MRREDFLARLGAKLRDGAPGNVAHPLRDVATVPEVAYTEPLDDPATAFERAAVLLGTQVRRAPFAEVLREVVFTHGVGTAVIAADAGVELTGVELTGVEVLPPERAAEAGLGVTGVRYAIAATGTLVLDARTSRTRTLSLLPPVHLAVVRGEQIVPHAGALFRRIGERFPDGLPSQLVLASGPSRSADIELTLTTGVHGPGHVWVCLD